MKILTSEAPMGRWGRKCAILATKFWYFGPKYTQGYNFPIGPNPCLCRDYVWDTIYVCFACNFCKKRMGSKVLHFIWLWWLLYYWGLFLECWDFQFRYTGHIMAAKQSEMNFFCAIGTWHLRPTLYFCWHTTLWEQYYCWFSHSEEPWGIMAHDLWPIYIMA